MDPTVFRRFYHEEIEEYDEDVAEPQYSDKRCDVSLEISEKSINESNLFIAVQNFRRPITKCLGGGRLAEKRREGMRTRRRARERSRLATTKTRRRKGYLLSIGVNVHCTGAVSNFDLQFIHANHAFRFLALGLEHGFFEDRWPNARRLYTYSIHCYPLEEPNIIVNHRFVNFQVSGMHPWHC